MRRIDVSNPESLTSTLFFRDTDAVYDFSVDSGGNAIYTGSLVSDMNTQVYRIQKSNGGFQDMGSSPREITITGAAFSQIIAAGSSSNAYFISGQGALVKMDPVSGAATNLVTRGDYGVFKIAVDDTGKVIFNALRLVDGKKVIGKVDASGSGPYIPTIIDDVMNSEVLVLERIQ